MGNTVPACQPPVSLTPEWRRPFDKKKKKKKGFQKYVTSLHAQWASLKKHSVAKGWVWWGLAFEAELSVWPEVR